MYEAEDMSGKFGGNKILWRSLRINLNKSKIFHMKKFDKKLLMSQHNILNYRKAFFINI